MTFVDYEMVVFAPCAEIPVRISAAAVHALRRKNQALNDAESLVTANAKELALIAQQRCKYGVRPHRLVVITARDIDDGPRGIRAANENWIDRH